MKSYDLKDVLGPAFEEMFADIPVPKHPLDNEQAAPFTTPDLASLKAARLGVEQIKRRNLEGTPLAVWPKKEGSEL